jgi:tRNA dimethylallyltransferase
LKTGRIPNFKYGLKTLLILTGPTGVGKTALSLELANALQSPILSCDSRQLYKEIPIGTAAPAPGQLSHTTHYFIGSQSIHDYYSAARYEIDVLGLLEQLFKTRDTVLMTGGSMLYIDAVCNGIDDMPDVDPLLRKELSTRFEQDGLAPILETLKELDPVYYKEVDRKNHKRVLHALEICLMTGKPFSDLRLHKQKKRSFNTVKICLNRDRIDLYHRIDARVYDMMDNGLLEEVKTLWPYRHLNALNTVGYKELFSYLEGVIPLDEAISQIQFHTHKYARKQLTWFRKDKDYTWFHPEKPEDIHQFLRDKQLIS